MHEKWSQLLLFPLPFSKRQPLKTESLESLEATIPLLSISNTLSLWLFDADETLSGEGSAETVLVYPILRVDLSLFIGQVSENLLLRLAHALPHLCSHSHLWDISGSHMTAMFFEVQTRYFGLNISLKGRVTSGPQTGSQLSSSSFYSSDPADDSLSEPYSNYD